MSKFLLYLPLEDYIAQWFIHEQGGSVPVQLTRGSVESKLLEVYLTNRPEDTLPEVCSEGMTAIAIPTFRNRPPEVFNYLPKAALNSLLSIIRSRFDVKLWEELHHFGTALTRPKRTGTLSQSGISVSATSIWRVNVQKNNILEKNLIDFGHRKK